MDVSFTFPLGDYVFEHSQQVFRYALCIVAVLSLFFARRSWAGIAIGISSAACWFALIDNLYFASILFAVALLCAVIDKSQYPTILNESGSSLWLPTIALTAFIAGILLRTLHLDTVTNIFEGELAPYMAAASSMKGSMIANKGILGPWAPLGILYYLPIYLCYQIFDVSIWAVRFSSALVGIFTIIVLFFVTRKIWGAKVALLATTFFSLNYLHIGWSRTDVHPHGVTAWPALLVALATFLFFEKKNFSIWRSIFLVMTMALTWHQYPSGQSAVAIPFLTAGFLFITGKLSIRQLAFIIPVLLVGAFLWYLGLPFSYYLADGNWDFPNPFTLTTKRTSWGNTQDQMAGWQKAYFVISLSFQYFVDVLQGIVNRAPYTHHQDYLAQIPSFAARTYAFLLVPFSLLGFGRSLRNVRDVKYAVLLGMLFAALAPGILSESPVPKRLSVTFLVLDILSAVGVAHIINIGIVHNRRFTYPLVKLFTVAATIVGICFLSTGFFSGRQYPIGTPIEETYGQIIRSKLTSNTLIVYDALKDYDPGEMIVLLIDDLYAQKNQPIFLSFSNSNSETLAYMKDFSLALKDAHRLPIHFAYAWTKLRDIFDSFDENHVWKRAVFLLQYKEDRESMKDFESRTAALQKECTKKSGFTQSLVWLEPERSFQNRTAVIVCEPS